jgi:hypothetical protein
LWREAQENNMNKRGRKKKEKKDLKKFIFNTNIEFFHLRDEFYTEAWNSVYEDEDDDGVCFCDECKPEFSMAVHHYAWNLYKEMMKEGRDFTRIINLGRRKINIDLSTDGRWEPHWTLGRDVGGKEDVFNALTEEEKRIVIMHPHFHNY